MLDQDNNFYLISLSILITCLLEKIRLSLREVTRQSLGGVQGLIVIVNTRMI